jgi:hypothetical protein
MVIQERHGHALQRSGRGRNLCQNVDAVTVILDHLLQAPNLALDTATPLHLFFVRYVSVSYS